MDHRGKPARAGGRRGSGLHAGADGNLAIIRDEWIQCVVADTVPEVVQVDRRIRRWAPIREMGNRYLRVVLLPDGETIHNVFFDRRFTP